MINAEDQVALQIIEFIYNMLESGDFISSNKVRPEDFTRDRKLPFAILFTFIVRRSTKSLQVILNEFIMKYNSDTTITNSAYSQARKKIKYSAFKNLYEGITTLHNELAGDTYKRIFGFRCIGIDASKIILPNTTEITDFFGATRIHTQLGDLGTYAHTLFECAYDVLNNLVVQASLNHCKSNEIDLASKMLPSFKEDDLLIFDRAYGSYDLISALVQSNKQFIIRLSKASFAESQMMFNEDSPWTKIVTLSVPRDKSKTIKEAGLPETVQVRLVKVMLSTGETEVLITSLLDDQYIQEDFKKLYWLRWGVETFFGKIKGRLTLENFTGKTLESVLQDFWATIFLSNLETIVTAGAQKQIDDKITSSPEKLEKKINKAVSFNAIKNSAFELFLSLDNKRELLAKLTNLFMTNTCVVRKDREVPRATPSTQRSLNFHKRKKKQVF
jgi:hypothetical protein